ncbi:MAG: tetratricopeptide repeat protein [Campylobacterales bacterium]|nr:tetratricopeptide repeat protein [Campylobacterales bacterium]
MNQKVQQLFQKAIAAHQKGDWIDAKKSYEKLLKLSPKHPVALHNLATIYQTQNNFNEAERLYKKAIYNKSDYFSAYKNLANLYLLAKQPHSAKEYYQKALEFNPHDAEIYNHLATLYDDESNYDKAIECYQKSLLIARGNPIVYHNLGAIYQNKKDFPQAQKLFIKAIELKNDYVDAYYNLALVCIKLNEFDKAKQLLTKTIALDGRHIKAHVALGELNHKLNNIHAAKEYYTKALQLDSNNIDAKWALSLACLLEKNYKEGWDFYRNRYHTDKKGSQKLTYDPSTSPKSLDLIQDKTLLIKREQGLGDIIQTVRLMPLLLEKQAKIICEVPLALKKILTLSYPTVDFREESKNLLFDYTIPMMDLFYLFNIEYNNIPYSSKYLSIDAKDSLKYQMQYGLDTHQFKIAINYQGNFQHANDRNRSIALEKLLEYLAPIEAAKLYSIQYERTQQEDDLLEKYGVVNLGKEAKDFYDTACFIDNMDLIISVDTSVAHLSGAIGKETFILLPFAPDWRWGLDDDKTNWYDSVTLFRQEEIDNWEEPLKKVVKAIDAKISISKDS